MITRHARRSRRAGWWIALAVGSLLATLASVGASTASASKARTEAHKHEAPLVICEDAEITGTYSAITAPNVNGAQAEVNHLNASGGILGHKVELVVHDNQSQVSLSGQVAQECVEQNHAWAIVGPSEAPDVIPVISVVDEAHVIDIDWAAGWSFPNTGITSQEYDGYAFPGRATSAYSDYLMLKDVVVPDHFTRVAMVEDNDPSSLLSGAAVDNYVKGFHLKLTSTQLIQPGQTNLAPVVDKLLQSKPQAILMNSIAGTESTSFIEALRAQNTNIPLGVCAGCTTQAFISSVGGPKGMHDVYCLGTPINLLQELLKLHSHNATNLETITDIRNYYEWMRKAGYSSPNVINSGAEGWNTIEMLADAAKRANSIDEASVMKALQHARDDTTGQIWQRTPAHYDQVEQENAIVLINANGTASYVKSPSI